MKDLYFYAAAKSTTSARALMKAAERTLRPFNQYLRQSVHTSKQRQTRYELPFRTVQDESEVQLNATDQMLFIPRPKDRWLIANWPNQREPDLQQQMMVVNRGETITIRSFERTLGGLRIWTDEELLDSDQVFWCGVPCTLRPERVQIQPRELRSTSGEQIKLLTQPNAVEEGWIVAIAGTAPVAEVLIGVERFEPKEISPFEGLSVVTDAQGKDFSVAEKTIKARHLPAKGLLRGNNGIRFSWFQKRTIGREGAWIQLLLPENPDGEEFMDPRAAFCEDEVKEVWTSPRHNKDRSFKVKRVDRENYQLSLESLPPEDQQTLFLPVDIRNLQLQQRALRQLTEEPLPHHQGLLRLCEDPDHVRWPAMQPVALQDWFSLQDRTRDGTEQQQEFVRKALATPDFAFMEGPPGSGKTRAICEIVQQLVSCGKRVLLCASTHVAIDNVLEQLIDSKAPVDALRIGNIDRIDERVQATQFDSRVKQLMAAWIQSPDLAGMTETERREMAERTVVMSANLTCGTTMGIVSHPLFRDQDQGRAQRERPICSWAHWDVLIVDEASKTLTQEFLVPALMAKRWIVVGDVKQLPPFTERKDLVANLRSLVDDRDRVVFNEHHQRACLLRFRLGRKQLIQSGVRWLIVESSGVLDLLESEVRKRDMGEPQFVRVVHSKMESADEISHVTVSEVRGGHVEALRLASAQWVLVSTDLLEKVLEFLPSDLLPATRLPAASLPNTATKCFLFRRDLHLTKHGRLTNAFKERGRAFDTAEKASNEEQKWLAEHDWAGEVAWRLTRIHELRRSTSTKESARLKNDLNELHPTSRNISDQVAEIQDIGLPSILEVLQEGIGEERTSRPSALTKGMRATNESGRAFDARFVSLAYQHRMHAEISKFPREVFYQKQSLLDANTIGERDAKLKWNFGPFASRRMVLSVDGVEHAGVNGDEVGVMRGVLKRFLQWVEIRGKPNRERPNYWEVACLAFYVKQERAISEMLCGLTQSKHISRFKTGFCEIVCGTVDRFQGREADLVLLSMRNVKRIGFLNSPNRLNVAVTRSRQQLVVLGKADYFSRCEVEELKALFAASSREDARLWLKDKP